MTEAISFLMGKHEAVLPTDRRYCRNHMWCRETSAGLLEFGFTSYAVRLMQDVYFLEWSVSPGASLQAKQQIGFIETSKATSDLFAPISGRLIAFNEALLRDPSMINVAPYGEGRLFEMSGSREGTLSVSEYAEFLVGAWETTQRLIKKQIHEES